MISDIPLVPESLRFAGKQEAEHLHGELKRELTPEHPLYEVPLEVFAMSTGIDDVLFRYSEQPERFALVHLTWLGKREIDARHPSVSFDGTLTEYAKWEASIFEQPRTR